MRPLQTSSAPVANDRKAVLETKTTRVLATAHLVTVNSEMRSS